jgi:hypothetical protein
MESNLEQARWLGEWLLALPSDAPAPDYLDQMDAVTDAAVVDAARRYFVPARRFVGRHDPILTAARGGAVVGVLLALGLGLTLRRRRVSGARAPDPSSGGGGR